MYVLFSFPVSELSEIFFMFECSTHSAWITSMKYSNFQNNDNIRQFLYIPKFEHFNKERFVFMFFIAYIR